MQTVALFFCKSIVSLKNKKSKLKTKIETFCIKIKIKFDNIENSLDPMSKYRMTLYDECLRFQFMLHIN